MPHERLYTAAHSGTQQANGSQRHTGSARLRAGLRSRFRRLVSHQAQHVLDLAPWHARKNTMGPCRTLTSCLSPSRRLERHPAASLPCWAAGWHSRSSQAVSDCGRQMAPQDHLNLHSIRNVNNRLNVALARTYENIETPSM